MSDGLEECQWNWNWNQKQLEGNRSTKSIAFTRHLK